MRQFGIYGVLHERLCKEQVLHTDETTLQVPKKAGRLSASPIKSGHTGKYHPMA